MVHSNVKEVSTEVFREIWKQARHKIPVIYRPKKGKNGEKSEPMLLRIPYSENNREWLQEGHNRVLTWNRERKCWEIPKKWFDELCKRLAERFGSVYVVQPYRAQQKCAPACWNAIGDECECSCGGEHHGQGRPEGRWYEVSDTCAVQWRDEKLGIKLLKPHSSRQHPHLP